MNLKLSLSYLKYFWGNPLSWYNACVFWLGGWFVWSLIFNAEHFLSLQINGDAEKPATNGDVKADEAVKEVKEEETKEDGEEKKDEADETKGGDREILWISQVVHWR